MEDHDQLPVWKIVERINFHKELAAWEEILLQENVTENKAHSFIENNNDKIVFAYIPHWSGGGMSAIIFGQKYVESVRLEKKYAKIID